MTIEAILKFKSPYDNPATAAETLRLMAIEANETFGEGGDPDAAQLEMFLGITNTPPQGGHVRLQIPRHFAQALEYVPANGGSPYAELIWISWPGEANPEPLIDWPLLVDGVEVGRQTLERFA